MTFRKEWLVRSNPGQIRRDYQMEAKSIGFGGFGEVCKATHKVSGEVRAVKAICKQKAGKVDRGMERLHTEIEILTSLDHPGIVKLYETFEDQQRVYMVMELCAGGELFDYIDRAGHFTETQAAIVMQQVIAAIFYLHENRVCHRDLKAENILLMSKDPIERNIIKLIDFGLARTLDPGQQLHTLLGTPYYVAPQVISGSYTEACDLWSCGVILYLLLCGYTPFSGNSNAEILAKVAKGTYAFKPEDWSAVSADAKNLIRMLLHYNPQKRFTAHQALNHCWIRERAPRAAPVPFGPTVLQRLRNFRSTNKFKKAALQVIASRLSEEKISNLREIFLALDTNGDGTLSLAEMQAGLANAGHGLKQGPVDLQMLINSLDCDGSGSVDYTEFLAATLDARQYLQQDVCWSAFCVFDRNGDGKISMDELRQVLDDHDVNGLLSMQTAQVMAEVDKDGNGEIDFAEFMAMMGGEGPACKPPRPASLSSPAKRGSGGVHMLGQRLTGLAKNLVVRGKDSKLHTRSVSDDRTHLLRKVGTS